MQIYRCKTNQTLLQSMCVVCNSQTLNNIQWTLMHAFGGLLKFIMMNFELDSKMNTLFS